jgi:hypothetical protein
MEPAFPHGGSAVIQVNRQKGIGGMLRKGSLLIVIGLIILGCAGCPAETGMRNGLTDGMSKAVSTAISTPVTNFITSLNLFK